MPETGATTNAAHADERHRSRRQHLGLADDGARHPCGPAARARGTTPRRGRAWPAAPTRWTSPGSRTPGTAASGRGTRRRSAAPSHTSGDTDRTEATGPGVTAAVTRSATTTAKASRPPSNSGDQSRGMNAKAATTAARAAKPPIVSPADGRTLMRVEQQGQRRSHQQLGGPGERGQVGQRRRDEHAADEGAHDPEADGDDEGPPRPGQQHGDGDRPDDVPLLLDGQRPEVGDRRRCPPQGVVATGGVDPPVLHVEQGGQEVAPQGGRRGAATRAPRRR